jgi:hypothetical protein
MSAERDYDVRFGVSMGGAEGTTQTRIRVPLEFLTYGELDAKKRAMPDIANAITFVGMHEEGGARDFDARDNAPMDAAEQLAVVCNCSDEYCAPGSGLCSGEDFAVGGPYHAVLAALVTRVSRLRDTLPKIVARTLGAPELDLEPHIEYYVWQPGYLELVNEGANDAACSFGIASGMRAVRAGLMVRSTEELRAALFQYNVQQTLAVASTQSQGVMPWWVPPPAIAAEVEESIKIQINRDFFPASVRDIDVMMLWDATTGVVAGAEGTREPFDLFMIKDAIPKTVRGPETMEFGFGVLTMMAFHETQIIAVLPGTSLIVYSAGTPGPPDSPASLQGTLEVGSRGQ